MAGHRDDGSFAEDRAHHGGRKVGRDYAGVPYPKLHAALAEHLSGGRTSLNAPEAAKYIVESLHATKKNLEAGSPNQELEHPAVWRGLIRGMLAPAPEEHMPEDAHLNDMWESRYEY